MNEKGAEPKEETCPPGTKYCNYIDRNGVVTRNCSSGLGVWPRVRCTRASWFTSCLCEGDNCNADCTWSNCTKIAISRSIDSVPDKTMLNCNANCKAGGIRDYFKSQFRLYQTNAEMLFIKIT